MSTALPKFGAGPITREVVEAVKGGQAVEARAAGKIGVAAVGSSTFLGIASKDAAPTVNTAGTTTTGFPLVDTTAYLVSQYVAVHESGHVPVVYAAAAAFGKALKCAAAGEVTPWVGGTDAADLIIGYCSEPGGVLITATGLMKISR